MENNCERCGARYSRAPSLLGRFCSTECGYAARTMERTTHRRMRYLPTHPLSGKTGLVSAARALLFDRIGPGWHACHWCSRVVEWRVGEPGNARDALIADHVDGDELNDAPDNVVPSCGSCNGTRARKVNDTEEYIVRKNGTRLRATRTVCHCCGETFFVAPSALLDGKGLFCSRSCARSKKRI